MFWHKLRLILTATSLTLSATKGMAFHIMLDPGHGGVDTGAVYGKAIEADLVLKVAQRLQSLLEANELFKVTLTRNNNQNLGLPARVKMAENANVDLFVSLHANAANDQRAKGVEFFFQNNLPADEESLFLANQENQMAANAKELHLISGGEDLSKKGDVTAIVEDLRRQNRMNSSLKFSQTLSTIWHKDTQSAQTTIKQAPFYVISKTSMPSVLIELGFLTNPHESKKLLKADYQKELAQKIYAALIAYRKNLDKPSNQILN